MASLDNYQTITNQ